MTYYYKDYIIRCAALPNGIIWYIYQDGNVFRFNSATETFIWIKGVVSPETAHKFERVQNDAGLRQFLFLIS